MPFSVGSSCSNGKAVAETVAATTIVVKLTTLKNDKANDGNGNDKHHQRQRQQQQQQMTSVTSAPMLSKAFRSRLTVPV